MGIVWSLFSDEFPKTEDKVPLGFRTPQGLRLENRPRVWFVSEDDQRIIQVQRDRFHFNWRKVREDDPYPRFESVYSAFTRHSTAFRDLVQEADAFVLEHLELTYVNLIPEDAETVDSFSGLFPDLVRRKDEGRYLPRPRRFHWNSTYALEGALAPLTIVATSLVRDGVDVPPAVSLELTVAGTPATSAGTHPEIWFDNAHETIVRGFLDFTAQGVQHDVWKRRAR
jgi:uncharacterized protein (TIGR04255 family)